MMAIAHHDLNENPQSNPDHDPSYVFLIEIMSEILTTTLEAIRRTMATSKA